MVNKKKRKTMGEQEGEHPAHEDETSEATTAKMTANPKKKKKKTMTEQGGEQAHGAKATEAPPTGLTEKVKYDCYICHHFGEHVSMEGDELRLHMEKDHKVGEISHPKTEEFVRNETLKQIAERSVHPDLPTASASPVPTDMQTPVTQPNSGTTLTEEEKRQIAVLQALIDYERQPSMGDHTTGTAAEEEPDKAVDPFEENINSLPDDAETTYEHEPSMGGYTTGVAADEDSYWVVNPSGEYMNNLQYDAEGSDAEEEGEASPSGEPIYQSFNDYEQLPPMSEHTGATAGEELDKGNQTFETFEEFMNSLSDDGEWSIQHSTSP